VPPDPNDPDLWDWSGDDDVEDFPRRQHPWRVFLVGIMVLALIVLVLISVL